MSLKQHFKLNSYKFCHEKLIIIVIMNLKFCIVFRILDQKIILRQQTNLN